MMNERLIGWWTVFLLFVSGTALMAAPEDQCITCHTDLDDEAAKKFVNDVHYKKGISCVGCHGGDPSQPDMEAAMDPKKGFTGVLKGDAIVDACLGCHSDAPAMSAYHSSIDVAPFQQFRNSVHGKSEILTCVTCHEIHEIRTHDDAKSSVFPTQEVRLCSSCHGDSNYMKTFNPSLATDQWEKYQTSVHGQKLMKGDKKVATCSDCHGSHAIFAPKDPRSSVYALNVPKTCANCHSNAPYMEEYNIPTDQYDQFISSAHGAALLKKKDTGAPACNDCHGNHGATPPGILSISHVCGSCHALNAEYFARSPHATAFEQAGIPQCEACHGNHAVKPPTDEMLRVAKNSVCEECHSTEERGYKVGQEMYQMIQTLKREADHAELLLKTAEEKGMDVSDARFKANDISATLIKARTVIHTMDLKDLKGEIDLGLELTQQISRAGQNAIDEYSNRRRGLGVSTLFITLLAIALYLKIRQIESRQRSKKDHT